MLRFVLLAVALFACASANSCDGVYQAEAATVTKNKVIKGSVVKLKKSDFITFNISGCSLGEVALSFRYARKKDTAAVNLTVAVDGTNYAVPFPRGINKKSYVTTSVMVTLSAGANVVKITAPSSKKKKLDIDYIMVGDKVIDETGCTGDFAPSLISGPKSKTKKGVMSYKFSKASEKLTWLFDACDDGDFDINFMYKLKKKKKRTLIMQINDDAPITLSLTGTYLEWDASNHTSALLRKGPNNITLSSPYKQKIAVRTLDMEQVSFPSSQPSAHPTANPSAHPSAHPSAQPSAQPSSKPSAQPSAQPSSKPSAQPSSKPSAQPSAQPSSKPSAHPSAQPSAHPSAQPSAHPSAKPSAHPSAHPSAQPTTMPSIDPCPLIRDQWCRGPLIQCGSVGPVLGAICATCPSCIL